jgi:hypothetical protein
MEIVARHTRRGAKLRTPQIFISLLAMESMSLVVLRNKRIIPWNKDYLWCIEETPHRTDSLTLLIAWYIPIGVVAAIVACPLPWANSVHSYRLRWFYELSPVWRSNVPLSSLISLLEINRPLISFPSLNLWLLFLCVCCQINSLVDKLIKLLR